MEKKVFKTVQLSSAQGVMIYKKDGTIIDYPDTVVDRIVCYSTSDGSPSGVEAVDLGLPSGTKWANMNVGASSAEDPGDYYAWGEVETKSDYSWETYMVTSKDDCGESDDPVYAACCTSIAGSKFDVATVKWGGSWKMPTSDQIDELLSECTWTWTTQKGVNGYEVTGSNGNSIFLPAAGYRDGSSLNGAGSYGYYWSAARRASYASYAYKLYFGSSYRYRYYYHGRYDGFYGASCLRIEAPKERIQFI